MKKCLLILAAFAVVLAGCNKPADTPLNTNATKDNAPAKPVASTEPKAADIAEVPATLKTDGYLYYGLDCKKTLTYKLVRQPNQGDQSGTQKVVYKGMVDGNPSFEIERAGDLMALGNDKLIVKADGVYSTFAAGTDINPPMLALPAKVEVGATWPSKMTSKGADDKVIKIDMTNKIERKEKIKVAGGEFDCFVATTTGELTNDKKMTVTGTSWYASGFGVVKMVLKITDAKGSSQTDTIELTSQG
ncbi:MAG: hypothetical protein JSS65_03795 [Armatimonadetes bacterium]|nr:hypothetical protein [Armatimonadota bacterium]